MSVRVGRRLAGAFLAAALLLGLAAATGVRALAAAGALLAALAAVAPRFPRRVPVAASLALASPHAVEEEDLGVAVELRNAGLRSVVADVCVALPGPSSVAAGEDAGLRVFPGRSQQRMDFKVEFHLFGLQRIGPVRVRVEDPFGLAAVEHEAAPAQEVRVYPHRDPLRDPVLKTKQMRSLIGRYEVSQPGQGFEFFGLRDYSVGDRPRDVNWKASARLGTMIVNQRQKESDAEVVLLVDVREATGVGAATRSPFAQGCRAALAIAEAHLRGRDAVRLIAYGADLVEDRHTGAVRQLQGILDLVVSLEPAGALPLGDVVHRVLPSLRRRSPVMLVSPLLGDPTIRAALATLRSHDLPVSALVPAPRWGPGAPEEAVHAWEARQRLEIQALRRMGIPVAQHGAEAPLAASLQTLEVRA
jgi:uncharacterized protein (DUF58 family)